MFRVQDVRTISSPSCQCATDPSISRAHVLVVYGSALSMWNSSSRFWGSGGEGVTISCPPCQCASVPYRSRDCVPVVYGSGPLLKLLLNQHAREVQGLLRRIWIEKFRVYGWRYGVPFLPVLASVQLSSGGIQLVLFEIIFGAHAQRDIRMTPCLGVGFRI